MDMRSDLWLYLPSCGLFIISFWICYRVRNHGGLIQYIFGLNDWKLALTSNIGSPFSLTMFLFTAVPLGYIYGAPLIIVLIISLIIVMPLALKIISSPAFERFYFEKEDPFIQRHLSIIDFVGFSLGSATKTIYGLVVLIFLFLFLLAEFSLIRVSYSVIFPNAPVSSFVFISGFMSICFMYTFLGGFIGILKTDRWQLVYILISVFVILHLHPKLYNILYDHHTSLYTFTEHQGSPAKIFKYIALLIYLVSWLIGSVDFWARNVCTLKNKSTESLKLVKYSLITIIFSGILMVILGIQIRSSGLVVINGNESDLPFVVLEQAVLRLNPLSKGFLLAGLAAACFTTIDTLIISFTQTYFTLIKNIKKESHTWSFYPNPVTIQIILFFTATCVSFCVTRNNINIWYYYFVHIVFILAAIIIIAVFFKKIYAQYLGAGGFVVSLILTYVIIVFDFRFTHWFRNYILLIYVPVSSLLITFGLIAMYKKIRLYRYIKSQIRTTKDGD